MKQNKPVPLESAVVQKILKWLNNQPECYAVKTRGDICQAGWPDIIGCFQGKSFALEVKRPGNNRVTTLQKATLEKWKEAGAITGVVHSIEEVKKLFKELK